MEGNVPPNLAMNDQANRGVCHAITPADGGVGQPGIRDNQPSDLDDLRFVQLGHRVSAAKHSHPEILAVLPDHVAGVVKRRAEEQVIGPNAVGPVAFVAYDKRLIEWPVGEFVGNPMRSENFLSFAESTVTALLGFAGEPYPAIRSFLNQAPEFGSVAWSH